MTREISYGAAINEALSQAMEGDDRVFVLGEGVDDPSGIFGSTAGLAERFGPERCFDTPLSEEALTGIANGAASCGLRPVLVHARVEFALLTLNQLLTHSAKWGAMYGARHAMPIVVRGVIGRGWGQGAQHSQALVPVFASTPGVEVIAPATAADAKGLLLRALDRPHPVVCLEHRQLYGSTGEVPADPYRLEFGSARTAHPGGDVTVVAISQMVESAVESAVGWAARGVHVEVIDPRTIVPLDETTILNSVSRTGRLVVVEYGWGRMGVGAEIIARCAEEGVLRAPARRVAFPRVATPSSPVLEEAFYPGVPEIDRAIASLLDCEADHSGSETRSRSLEESW